jgi:GH15 family glucan-1,4-alpha-glucosidase
MHRKRGRACDVAEEAWENREWTGMASRIEDYAMLGDGRTAALVSRIGSIDWLCLPRFDSDACCAALLGDDTNGCWQIAPCEPFSTTRRYQDDTLVLHTEFTTGTGVVRLTDFMDPGAPQPTLVRLLEGLDGTVRMRCHFALRFDYGLMPPRMVRDKDALLAMVGADMVALRGSLPLEQRERGNAVAAFDVAAGQKLAFVLSYGPSHGAAPDGVDPEAALQRSLSFWRDWAVQFQFATPWREPVMRSLLTLKALIYRPTGGMVAAATTSLPEMPNGSLNWDYRYAWLRDATFTISALLNAGYHQEAIAWRDWMLRAIAVSPEHMRIMYRVDGSRHIKEWPLEWLSGYQGASPVRIGNDAAAQRQIDVVGELLDALDLLARAGVEPTPEVLRAECDLIGRLEQTWHEKGHGLWESRGRPEHYTYSMVMAWVGVDRFLRGGARRRGTDAAGVDAATLRRLCALRRRIRDEVTERCWNHARGHFVDRLGGERLDASLLLLPLVGFLPADDPRMAATIDAVERTLSKDGLVWRTPPGGDTAQGAFIACSCWLADCRSMQGRRDAAVAILERVLALRNDVGLLSEEYHPGLRQLMGNFPQALSHLAVVNTALGLSGPVLQRGGG